MNERIGKLAEEAGLLGPSSRIGDAHDATEKFAELILLEIRLLIADERIENDNPVVDDALVSVLISIEKHFGVEE